MGLDNAYGSLGLRTGVCSSTSRPASPYEGQVIYETDTNRVLVWDNSAWVMIADTDSPPGLQLIKTQTIGTTVSSVTVSDVFSSEFDNYRIIVCGGAGSAGSSLRLTLGSTTSSYYQGGAGSTYAGVTNLAQVNNGAFWAVGNGTTSALFSTVDVYSPFLSDETFVSGFAANADTSGANFSFSGFLNNTTSYTAFTITPSTGTITGGTIRVYGYRNS